MKSAALCSVLFLLALPALAVDISGKWSGGFSLTSPDGNLSQEDVYMVVKVKGKEVTGTAGPSRDEQWLIQKGKIEGDKITFEVQDPNNVRLWKVQLVFMDGHLKGEAWAEVEGKKMGGKLDLQRQAD